MADATGSWTFAGKDLIAPGTHDLRVDQIDKGGKVIARVELPFLREKDVIRISKSKGVPSAVVAQARKLLMQRRGGKA